MRSTYQCRVKWPASARPGPNRASTLYEQMTRAKGCTSYLVTLIYFYGPRNGESQKYPCAVSPVLSTTKRMGETYCHLLLWLI